MFTDDENRPFFEPSDADNDIHIKDTKHKPVPASKKPQSIGSSSNLPFIYFITSAVLTVCLALLTTLEFNAIAYFVSGIMAISICLFAIKHFRTLIDLTKEIDHFHELNRKFQKEGTTLNKHVDRISSARKELEDTHKRLVFYNKNTKENLKKFRQCRAHMQESNVKCVDQLQSAIDRAALIELRWHNELYQHQRTLLHHAFDRFCTNQTHIGMTKSEFDVFCSQIPAEYRAIFGKMGTFEKLAEGKEYILLEDFAKTLDIFAEMQVNDCEIEFHLKTVEEKPRVLDPKQALRTHKKNFKHNKKHTMGTFGQIPLPSILAPLSSISEGKTIDSDSSDEEIESDNREYDDNWIRYQRNVVITKRSFSINSEVFNANESDSMAQMRRYNSVQSSLRSPVARKSLYSTQFNSEFVTDLTSLYEMPDIDYTKTYEIENTHFTDEQINTHMARMKHDSV